MIVLGGMLIIANLSNAAANLKRWGVPKFILINVLWAAVIYFGVRLYKSWKEDKEIERQYREKTARPIYNDNMFMTSAPSAAGNAAPTAWPAEEIDDITYIREIRHSKDGIWNTFDVMLNSRGYGWQMMLDWADYMAAADLTGISSVTAGNMGQQEEDLTDAFQQAGGKVSAIPALEAEQGSLSVGGLSRTLNRPVKITWINQTRVLRFVTLNDQEESMRRYCETMIRRTFGTEDAMKLAKPIPEQEKKPETSTEE